MSKAGGDDRRHTRWWCSVVWCGVMGVSWTRGAVGSSLMLQSGVAATDAESWREAQRVGGSGFPDATAGEQLVYSGCVGLQLP